MIHSQFGLFHVILLVWNNLEPYPISYSFHLGCSYKNLLLIWNQKLYHGNLSSNVFSVWNLLNFHFVTFHFGTFNYIRCHFVTISFLLLYIYVCMILRVYYIKLSPTTFIFTPFSLLHNEGIAWRVFRLKRTLEMEK